MVCNLASTNQRTFNEVFEEDFLDWICTEHFKVPISSPRSIRQYSKEFSKYSSKQLEELCELAFREKYLPPVNWFHEQGQVLINRDELDRFVPAPPFDISEEQRLFNLVQLKALSDKFFGDRSW